MKVLIDTCVVIDLLQKREPFFDDAHMTFLAAANHQFEGAISAKSVTDIYYLMHRFLHDDSKSRKALERSLNWSKCLIQQNLIAKKHYYLRYQIMRMPS